jgi:hypothetical protein
LQLSINNQLDKYKNELSAFDCINIPNEDAVKMLLNLQPKINDSTTNN